jgi:hypothetical protein
MDFTNFLVIFSNFFFTYGELQPSYSGAQIVGGTENVGRVGGVGGVGRVGEVGAGYQ